MNPQERNHIVHFIFPGLFVAKSAKGKTSTALTYVANQMCRSPSKYGDLSAQVDSIPAICSEHRNIVFLRSMQCSNFAIDEPAERRTGAF
jgi:hypothetical protein